MRLPTSIAAMCIALAAFPAAAADTPLLIQTQPDGHYKVWHTEGATQISDDEALALDAAAVPEGSEPLPIATGTARSFETPAGTLIKIVDAKADAMLLVERDACGAVKVWHEQGATALSDDQLTELVLNAVPGGGKSVVVGDLYGKAFLTKSGVVVVLWKPGKKEPSGPQASDQAQPSGK
jgi:hypothetical protein